VSGKSSSVTESVADQTAQLLNGERMILEGAGHALPWLGDRLTIVIEEFALRSELRPPNQMTRREAH
jgi:hypothetical protein